MRPFSMYFMSALLDLSRSLRVPIIMRMHYFFLSSVAFIPSSASTWSFPRARFFIKKVIALTSLLRITGTPLEFWIFNRN